MSGIFFRCGRDFHTAPDCLPPKFRVFRPGRAILAGIHPAPGPSFPVVVCILKGGKAATFAGVWFFGDFHFVCVWFAVFHTIPQFRQKSREKLNYLFRRLHKFNSPKRTVKMKIVWCLANSFRVNNWIKTCAVIQGMKIARNNSFFSPHLSKSYNLFHFKLNIL